MRATVCWRRSGSTEENSWRRAGRVQGPHAAYYLGLAERAEPELTGTLQRTWLERLETERGNLRAALSWALESAEAELGLRLAGTLGEFWRMRGYLSEGRRCLELARNAQDGFAVVVSLMLGAHAYLGRGEYLRAETFCEEGLQHLPATENDTSDRRLPGQIGGVGRLARAACTFGPVWGAAEALREAIGAILSPLQRSYYEPHIAAAHSQLDEEGWEAAWEEGRAMTPEQAIEYAFSEMDPSFAPATTSTPASYLAGLSAREAEVLKLVAKGLTNAQVAKELFISPNTEIRHLNSIYQKLGVSSRAVATRFAVEHELV
jgi:DNA-binding CsgD family transcriptional regulator